MKISNGFLLCCFLNIAPITSAISQTDDLFRVTLLGTGAPAPNSVRMGPSTLVEAGSHKLLFDVGRGASIRIVEYGLKLGDITELFITHLHGDHVVGITDFWLTGYMRFSGREGDLKMYGPVGVKNIAEGLESGFTDVNKYWGISRFKPGFSVVEFSSDSIVFHEDNLKVTAFKVNHSQASKADCYGYKVEYEGRSVIISGDTGYSENLIKHSMGVDLLIHEVMVFEEEGPSNDAFINQLKLSHAEPEEAAQVFNITKPKVAVAYHLGPNVDAAKLSNTISKSFSGMFYVSHDLMSFNIGKTVELVR